MLELCGFLLPVTQTLGFAAAGLETIYEVLFEVRKSPAAGPLHHGYPGIAFRIAGLLEVPAALAIRVLSGFVARRPLRRGNLFSRWLVA